MESRATLDVRPVVEGDAPTQADVRHLRTALDDAFAAVGRGLGHTFPQPISIHGLVIPSSMLRIDYVYFKGSLTPIGAQPLPLPGSDHRALLAELAVTDPASRRRSGAAGRSAS